MEMDDDAPAESWRQLPPYGDRFIRQSLQPDSILRIEESIGSVRRRLEQMRSRRQIGALRPQAGQ